MHASGASAVRRIEAVENYPCIAGRMRDAGAVAAMPHKRENAPMADVVDVILRDGSTLRLRPPTRADADAILDFFRALSEQSLYMRFHGFPSLGPEVVEQVLDSDWAERGALLGSLVEDGSERVVALANYARLRDPSTAETAFAVADAYPAARASARASSSSSPSARPITASSGSSRSCCPTTGGCSASSRRSGSS